MDIWGADKLLIFIVFVIPGFISIKAYDLIFPGVHQESSKQIIEAVTYSSLNYALLLWPIMAVETSLWKILHPNLYALFLHFVLFGMPVLIFGWAQLRTRSWFQNLAAHPTQKPWDYVFAKRKSYWIKVVLKDGTKLGGKYWKIHLLRAHRQTSKSFWKNRGSLTIRAVLKDRKIGRQGIMVISSEIAYIELVQMEFPGEKTDERKEAIE